MLPVVEGFGVGDPFDFRRQSSVAGCNGFGKWDDGSHFQSEDLFRQLAVGANLVVLDPNLIARPNVQIGCQPVAKNDFIVAQGVEATVGQQWSKWSGTDFGKVDSGDD